jgi:glycosyltransferase involved in cell wall biosynthesis
MRKKISIITAVYNGEKLLPNLIDSIRQQTCCDTFEFIIIDGGSKDQTVDLIKQNKDIVDYWISEKDEGIYDAWNKGLKAATGAWIMFLGCDDLLMPDAIENYTKFLSGISKDTEFISSKVQMIDERGNFVRVKGWKWEWPKLLKEMTVAHPGALHSKKLFDVYGNFDKNFKIVGDYEFLLRAKNNLNADFMNKVTVLMREGGVSDSLHAVKEHCLASTGTGGYSKIRAYSNAAVVASKFILKKTLRHVGMNVYLKT